MSAEQSVTEAPEQQAPSRQEAAGQTDAGQAAGGQAGDEHNGNGGGYELDEDGQRVQHGMGQSKSSRRRRRKRKGKGPEGAAEGAGSGPGESDVSLQADGADFADASSSAPQGAGAQPANGNGFRAGNGSAGRSFAANGNTSAPGAAAGQAGANGQAANAPGGTKRWKKKFRDRERPGIGTGAAGFQPGNGSSSSGSNGGGFTQGAAVFRGPDTHQPGNNASKRKSGFGGGGAKQGRSGGSRGGFVGPMDHSYRVVNGNVFDPAQSTVEQSSGGRGGRGHTGDSQPIDYSQGRAIPIKEGAPTRIYFFIDDLFFTAKIQETARKLGVKIAFIKNEKEQIAALTSGEEEDRPGLIVFDLNNAGAKPLTLIPKLKTKLKKTTSIIGFLSHLQGDLKAKAVEAGCDTVMPRAAFSQNLPNLLRRYGVEEVEEQNYNQ